MYELSIPCCVEHHFSIQSPSVSNWVCGSGGVSLKSLKTDEGEQPVRIEVVFCQSAWKAPRMEII